MKSTVLVPVVTGRALANDGGSASIPRATRQQRTSSVAVRRKLTKGLLGSRWIVGVNALPRVCHKRMIVDRFSGELRRKSPRLFARSRAAPGFRRTSRARARRRLRQNTPPRAPNSVFLATSRPDTLVSPLKGQESASPAVTSRTSLSCCNNLTASDRNFRRDQHDYNLPDAASAVSR